MNKRFSKSVAVLCAASVVLTSAASFTAYADDELNVSPGESVTAENAADDSGTGQNDSEVPAEPTAAGTWNVVFYYDQSTGVLSWDNIPGLPMDLESTGWGRYASYALVGTGETGVITEYYAGSDYDVDWSSQNQLRSGDVYTPYINIPLNMACDVIYGKDLEKGQYIFEFMGGSEFDSYGQNGIGTFTYEFGGGDLDPSLPVPTNVNQTGNKVSWTPTRGAIGYIMMVSRPTGRIDYIISENSFYEDFSPEGLGQVLAVCSVDINGNYSEWSGESAPAGSWDVTFSYDNNSGNLSWNNIPGLPMDLESTGWGSYAQYFLGINGSSIGDKENGYFTNSVYVVDWLSAAMTRTGDVEEPYVNLPLNFVSDIMQGRYRPKGTYSYTVTGGPKFSYSDYTGIGTFTYEFNGGDLDNNIATPQDLVIADDGKSMSWSSVDGVVGYLIYVGGKGYGHYWLSGENFAIALDDVDLSTAKWIKIWAIDINGNYGEPLVYSNFIEWDATLSYDDTTGTLTWDQIPDAPYDFETAGWGWYCTYNAHLFNNDNGTDVWIWSPSEYVVDYETEGEPRTGDVIAPSANIPLAFNEYALKNGSEIPAGSYTATIQGGACDASLVIDETHRSKENFFVSFGGTRLDRKAAVPNVDVVGTDEDKYYDIQIDNIPDAIGYIYKIDGVFLPEDGRSGDTWNNPQKIYSISRNYDDEFTIERHIGLKNLIGISVCAVFADGSRSAWSGTNTGSDVYNAYIGFQTTPYSFRNAWTEPEYGKDTPFFDKFIVWPEEEGDADCFPQYKDSFDYDVGGYVLDASYTDVSFKEYGTYTVKAEDIDWALDGASDFNLIFVSTDIPNDGRALCTEAKIIVDGEVTKTVEYPITYEDNEYLTFNLCSIWDERIGGYGGAFPTSSLAIQFTLAEPEPAHNAYIGFQTTPYSFRNAWTEPKYGKDTPFFDKFIVWPEEEGDADCFPQYKDSFDYDVGGYVLDASYTDVSFKEYGTYTVKAEDIDWALDGASDFNLIFVSTDIPNDGKALCTDAKIIVDGEVTKTVEFPICYEDDEYLTIQLCNIWDERVGGYDGAFPTESLAVEFTIAELNLWDPCFTIDDSGFLSWDNIPDMPEDLETPGWGEYGSYTLKIKKDDLTFFSNLASFYDIDWDNGQKRIGTVNPNCCLPVIMGAWSAMYDIELPAGSYEISVFGGPAGEAYTHEGSKIFNYSYSGTVHDPEAGIPEILKHEIRTYPDSGDLYNYIIMPNNYETDIVGYIVCGIKENGKFDGETWWYSHHPSEYRDFWDIEYLYDKDKSFIYCAVFANGNMTAWSAPVSVTNFWDSGMQYDEETGILSWNDIPEAKPDFSKDGWDFFCTYMVGLRGINNSGVHFDIWGQSDYATDDNGTRTGTINTPFIVIPLQMAVYSLESTDGSTFADDYDIVINGGIGYEPAGWSSNDNITYHYEGARLNTELEAPAAELEKVGTDEEGNDIIRITYSNTDGVVGYIMTLDGEYADWRQGMAYALTARDWDNNVTTDEFTVSSFDHVNICAVYADGSYTPFSGDIALASLKPVVTATPGDGAVVLTWEAVEGADKYAAYIVQEDGTLKALATKLITTAYTAANLTNGKEYTFVVRAYVNGKWSKYNDNDKVSAIPFCTKPKPVAEAGNKQVTLTWDEVDGASKYAAYIVQEDKTLKALATKLVDTTYTAVKLTNGTKYTFVVRAYVNGKWTSYGDEDMVECIPTRGKPDVTAIAGDGSVTLTWDEVETAIKYAAYTVNADGTLKPLATKITGTSYTAANLTNGTKYTFVVRAYVNGKWSAYDNKNYVTCTPAAAFIKPEVTTKAGDTKVTLTWNAIDSAAKFAVYTVNADGTLKALTTKLTDTTYTASKLTNGTEYTFVVRAYENGKWTPYNKSDYVKATPVSSVVKPVPEAEPADKQVTLTWKALDGATKYAVYMVQEDGTLKALATKLTVTEYTAKKLTNHTEYKFLVRAYVNGKWTKYDESDYVACTPAVLKPLVRTSSYDGMITLRWSAVDNATKYAAYIVNDDGSLSCVSSKITNVKYTVKNLTNGTTYKFVVRAYVDGTWTKYTERDIVSAVPGV